MKSFSNVLTTLAGTCAIASVAWAQQASITLQNSDAKYCYKHENLWTLTKEVSANTVNEGVGTVTWTVTAVKASGPTTFTVLGGLTVYNSGSAPAPIGNIVINLQKPNSQKIGGKNVPWVSAAADIANAASGDAATTANIVAAGSQESQPFNAAFGAGNYTVSGARGTFVETAGSGSLEFTDATLNTAFSLVPQQVIPAGQSVTLLYQASFNTAILPAAGTALRVEALVTFANAGARGGSGATAPGIDVDGNPGFEAYVRTVPSRVTLAPLPTAPAECNATVTVSDLESAVSVTGTVTTANPVNFGEVVLSDSATFDVSVDVDAGESGGRVCNTVTLTGTSESISLNVVIGQQVIGQDPLTGADIYGPVYASLPCCVGADLSASACVDITPGGGGGPPPTPKFCTYTQGGFAGPGAPGQTFVANWATVFPDGLTIGIDDGAGGPKHHAKWTSVTALRTWLAGGGPSGALTGDTLNAPSTSGGTLAKQTATLAINIALNDEGVIGAVGFGDLKLCNTGGSLDGKTVREILDAANAALGGYPLPAGYSFGDLNTVISRLNDSAYHECVVGPYAVYLCLP